MNVYKHQSIQKAVIEQSGNRSLMLNDMILGNQGTRVVASLIPEYHPQLHHLQIKGNNIDSQAFEDLCMSLLNCSQLRTIQAQWNSIGSSPAGLLGLSRLVGNVRHLEYIDLKNNRIAHQLADIIAQIIKINSASLRNLDLRWNELGEIGAQKICVALKNNSYLQFLGLEDNRISTYMLKQVQNVLRSDEMNKIQNYHNLKHSISQPQPIRSSTFPISEGEYPSMDIQVKAEQLRGKIDNEQKQAQLYIQKLQGEIEKVLHKIKVKGSTMSDIQIRYEAISNENIQLMNHLRQSERMLSIDRQRCMGIDRGLNAEKSTLRNEKYQVNCKIQTMMQKITHKQQRQIEDLAGVMAHRKSQLEAILRDKLSNKRKNRQRLVELKQDILKFKMQKQSVWNRVVTSQTGNKSSWEDQCLKFENQIAQQEAALKSEQKKGKFLSEQLTNLVVKGLKKQQKYEKDIFSIQSKIKSLHNEMTLANIDIEQNQAKNALLESEIITKDHNVSLTKTYIQYIQDQSGINQDMQRYKIQQANRLENLAEGVLDKRVTDLQKTFRNQQSNNKILRNQYEKLGNLVQSASKTAIYNVLFG